MRRVVGGPGATDACCINGPTCFNPIGLTPQQAMHSIGRSRGADDQDDNGDDKQDDRSWIVGPSQGCAYMAQTSIKTVNMNCSSKFAYKVTHMIAMNDFGNDAEIGRVAALLWVTPAGKTVDSAASVDFPIFRRHFSSVNFIVQANGLRTPLLPAVQRADIAVPFPIAFRHQRCDADSWNFPVFVGTGFPREDKKRRSVAKLQYFGTIVESYIPESYDWSYFRSLSARVVSAGIFSGQTDPAGYLVQTGPSRQFAVSATMRVEFTLNLSSFDPDSSASSSVLRLEFFNLRSQAVVFSRQVARSEFPQINRPIRIVMSGFAHTDFGANIDLRVFKYYGFAVTFTNASVCVETDGSTCDEQALLTNVCPPQLCPVPPPSFQCSLAGEFCDENPCCSNLMCQRPSRWSKKGICVSRPPAENSSSTCCVNTPCIPPAAFSPRRTFVTHSIGGGGRDFDGKRRDKDDSWITRPAEGSNFHFETRARIRDFGIPCSRKHGVVVTHMLAIDNNDMDDEEVGTLHHRLDYLPDVEQSVDHKVFTIKRRHFSRKKQALPFKHVFRHLDCNTDARVFRFFAGAGFPSEDSRRAGRATLIHYGTTIERLSPYFYSAAALFSLKWTDIAPRGWVGPDSPGYGPSGPALVQSSFIGVLDRTGIVFGPRSRAGYLVYTNQIDVLPVGDLQVEFVIRLDDKFTFALTDKMADIDLYCAASNVSYGFKTLKRSDFPSIFSPVRFTMTFNNALWSGCEFLY